MPRIQFPSIESIPEAVPDELLLDVNADRFRVPREDLHSSSTTTPIEVGYILFETPSNLHLYKKRLLGHVMLGEASNDFLDGSWMNHAGRAVVRAALDPERTAPINMLAVYRNELKVFGGRFPARGEEDYFRHFTDTFGVLERTQN
jgi:hypothetical protein